MKWVCMTQLQTKMSMFSNNEKKINKKTQFIYKLWIINNFFNILLLILLLLLFYLLIIKWKQILNINLVFQVSEF